MLQHERRRHVRKSGLLVRVSVTDQRGHVCLGTVLNVSDGGVGLLTESLPGSELLDIQPENLSLWIRVKTKHCTPAASGHILGCAFQSAPTPEILKALHVPR